MHGERCATRAERFARCLSQNTQTYCAGHVFPTTVAAKRLCPRICRRRPCSVTFSMNLGESMGCATFATNILHKQKDNGAYSSSLQRALVAVTLNFLLIAMMSPLPFVSHSYSRAMERRTKDCDHTIRPQGFLRGVPVRPILDSSMTIESGWCQNRLLYGSLRCPAGLTGNLPEDAERGQTHALMPQ